MIKKNKLLTFWEHVYEIRNRVLRVLIFTFLFTIISYLLFPYFITTIHDVIGEELYITNITEGFLTKLKVCILIGVLLSIPLLFIEFILFIFPALEKKQKRIMLLIILSTFSLFIGGIIFAYRSVLPISIEFLKSRNFFPDNVNRLISYNNFIEFFFQFLIGFGICFQFPIVIIFLLKMELLNLNYLIKNMKYFIIIIFIISAIITPPDVVSQVLLAIPMIILYLLCILIGFIFRLGRK